MRWAFERFFGGMPGASETESVCVMIRLASSGCTRTHVHTKARCEKTRPFLYNAAAGRACCGPSLVRSAARVEEEGCGLRSLQRRKGKGGFEGRICGAYLHEGRVGPLGHVSDDQLPNHIPAAHDARPRRFEPRCARA
jgi:hypothetical protein